MQLSHNYCKNTSGIDNQDTSKLELYRLIGERHKAMQEGRDTSFKSVKEV